MLLLFCAVTFLGGMSSWPGFLGDLFARLYYAPDSGVFIAWRCLPVRIAEV